MRETDASAPVPARRRTSTSGARARGCNTPCTAAGPRARRVSPIPTPSPVHRRRDRAARRERARGRLRLLRARRAVSRRPISACSRTPPTTRAASATSCASATSTPVPTSPTWSPTRTTASAGRTTASPSSTPAPTTRCGRGRCGVTGSGHRPADDELVFQEDDERFYVVDRSHPQRPVPRGHGGVEADDRGVVRRGRHADRAVPRRDSAARRRRVPRRAPLSPTSTATGSSCSRTTTPRTSGSWSRRPPPPDASTGSRSFGHRDDTRLDDIDAFAGHLVLSERADALEQVRVLDLAHRRPTTSSRCPTRCTPSGSAPTSSSTRRRRAARVHVACPAAVELRLRPRRPGDRRSFASNR